MAKGKYPAINHQSMDALPQNISKNPRTSFLQQPVPPVYTDDLASDNFDARWSWAKSIRSFRHSLISGSSYSNMAVVTQVWWSCAGLLELLNKVYTVQLLFYCVKLKLWYIHQHASVYPSPCIHSFQLR